MPESHDTKTRILDEAVRIISVSGVSSLRLRDVAHVAGIAEPSIYHYFSSRDALVVAALGRRFETELAVTAEPFLPAVEKCTSRDDFLAAFRSVYLHSFEEDRAIARAHRAEIFALSFRHPNLRISIGRTMMKSLWDVVEALRLAQNRGWLRSDIDIEAFSLVNFALISSRIFPETLDDHNLIARWDELVIAGVMSFLLRRALR